MGDAPKETEVVPAGEPGKAPLDRADEPPVVARMVIEIRSDGTRTIARGAMEDLQLGQRAAIEAEGASPAELAASLLKQLALLPFTAKAPAIVREGVKQVVKALLPTRREPPK